MTTGSLCIPMNFNPTPRPTLHATRASELLSRTMKPREWMVQGFIPMKQVTLLYGDGGSGKSTLALQLANAAVKLEKWLDLPTKAGATYYLSCEDDSREIQRRLHDFGSKAIEVDDLVVMDCVGKDTYLVEITPDNKLAPTDLYRRLEEDLKAFEPKLLILDNLADIFPEEGYGRVLPRAFMNMLRGLANQNDCAILILAHPSKAGISTGRGDDGSTAWNNSARSRLYFKSVDGDETAKTLTVMKSNHAATGTELTLRFVNNRFERELEVSQAWKTQRAEEQFIALLKMFTEQGQRVNSNAGANYAPKKFADHPTNEGFTKAIFGSAMQSLLAKNKIKIVKGGSQSRPTTWLEIV